ncbi:hypothetical protein [Mastigocoleus sp. MO_188.B34]|uniref:hypothetical protein n=1 Tax=Mastigocoleus sp. MO_188.B34 TaxID=3036635 RepID=UPI00262EC851|nr:hypothetical protein [Mastigocoleus sp. MO_188.B34]MDJ0697148.1 hypothetical protein [Mastigocoleus sp. MO_188.B34]
MPAFDELKKKFQKLMEQEENIDIAFDNALKQIKEYEDLANDADKKLKLKHKMIIEMNNIQEQQ